MTDQNADTQNKSTKEEGKSTAKEGEDALTKILPDLDQELPDGKFHNSLLDLFGNPGGPMICLLGWLCPCIQTGKVNEALGGPYGFWGGCLAMFVPLLNLICVWSMGHKTAALAGFRPDLIKSILKSWCLGSCYMCQVRRQQLVLGLENGVVTAMSKQGDPNYGAAKEPNQAV